MNFLEECLCFIFPKACGICEKIEKNYLCLKCLKNIENSNLFCNKIDNCKKDKTKYFDYHAYLFLYKGIIREKIIQYKFENKPYLSNMFCEFFIKNKKICGFLKKYDIIISVPMTKVKIAKRGYNQTELIAKLIAKNIKNIQYKKDILIKIKDNKIQSTLNKKQRIENVKNAYKLKNAQIIKQKNILILDDIYTTGATVNECAKMLKQQKCNVSILTIAKDI